MTTGLFAFGYPLLKGENGIFLGDACLRQTLEICRPMLAQIWLAGRCRNESQASVSLIPFEDLGARLKLVLPDFASGGPRGLLASSQSFLSPDLLSSIQKIVVQSAFVFTDTALPTSFMMAKAAAKFHKPVILEMRGEVVLNPEYMKQRFGLIGVVYCLILRRLFEWVRRQAVAAVYVTKDLRLRFPIAGRLAEVISDVRLPDELFMESRRFVRGAAKFLYVGHLERVKCVDLILHALAKIVKDLPSDWRFDIVGEGPEHIQLEKLADSLQISSHVRFHGRVAWGKRLFDMYRQSDMLLMASITEGASRTLLEAMAAALPIVSTAVGQAPDLLDKEVLVKPNNISGYAAILTRVVSDNQLLSKFSERNSKRAKPFRQRYLLAQRKNFYRTAIEVCTTASRYPGR